MAACSAGLLRIPTGKAVPPLQDRECMGWESCVGVCDGNAIFMTGARVALDTCLHLLGVMNMIENETEDRRSGGR
jgi:hypothetical protein